MPQTMLAMLALATMTLFAMRQHERAIHLQREVIRNEVATQMMAVAVDHLEEIGRQAFDEATLNGAKVTSKAMLTPVSEFPLRKDTPSNDIDDFHDDTTKTFRVSNGLELWFDVVTRVTYADPENPDVSVTGPTKVKKATVKVYAHTRDPDLTKPDPKWIGISIPDTVILSQSYACGSRCDFAN